VPGDLEVEITEKLLKIRGVDLFGQPGLILVPIVKSKLDPTNNINWSKGIFQHLVFEER
jgi:hypothetical protein